MSSYTSYTSGPPSGNIYQRSSSIINETDSGSFNDPAPNRSNVGFRSNEEAQTESQRNLDSEADQVEGQGQGPSFTDIHHVVGKSIPGSGSLVGSDYGSGAPDVDAYVRQNMSNPNQDNSTFTQEEKSPGLSGQVHTNQSKTSVAAAAAAPINQADYVGISLVGRKFKEVNPTAYYVEK